MRLTTSERLFWSHSSLMKLRPPKRIKALTTPMSAPPAMKPEAMSVPFSPRSLLMFSSFVRVVTYQLIAPPTTSGMFSSIGMNMPSAKARAGTPQSVSTMARTAPMA